MDAIQELFKINLASLSISMLTILFALKAIAALLEWALEKTGMETKWMRNKREEHTLLIQTSEHLTALQKEYLEGFARSDEKDEELRGDIQKLTHLFVEKEIDDLRWKILDACSALSNGRRYNREMFDHIIHMYDKYEKILEENHMENGLIEESIKFVREKYRRFLEEGDC
ncbi:MAG: hypothetical protein HFI31_07690 [Lachnospiraceae bacterium]|nr:hypothetical protein [Lachnospiraceae bacterium]MCI9134052.1 hypothetical protein [Lachnospiraceae bacterium]